MHILNEISLYVINHNRILLLEEKQLGHHLSLRNIFIFLSKNNILTENVDIKYYKINNFMYYIIMFKFLILCFIKKYYVVISLQYLCNMIILWSLFVEIKSEFLVVGISLYWNHTITLQIRKLTKMYTFYKFVIPYKLV